MRPLYIFDLDGTLANADHRLHFINGETKDWRAFFAACVDDSPIPEMVTTFKTLQKAGAECWIWTGRSDQVMRETDKWLETYVGFDVHPFLNRFMGAPERFLMRKAGDHRPDHVLKAEWLAQLEPPEYARLTGVFEDRSRVVAMWREAGVSCFQVAPGEF